MHRIAVSAVTAAATLALLAGCGAPVDAGSSGPGSSGPGSTGIGPTETGPGEAQPSTRPSQPSIPTGPSGSALVLDGVAQRGVEAGCVVLSVPGGRRYELVTDQGRPSVPLGVPIRVRGVILTGVLSYCQQGTPLKVMVVSRR